MAPPTYLQRSHSQLLTTSALSNLGQIVDKSFKDVGSIQVTVIVHIDVNDTLGIWKEQHLDQRLEGTLPDRTALRGALPAGAQRQREDSGVVPAQMRVSVWITIHLCSKELLDVSRMVRKISLKNTSRKTRRKKCHNTARSSFFIQIL